MARPKKVKIVDQHATDDAKIAAWMEKNKVQKIAQNVSGNPEPRGFFQRRKKIAGKAVTPKSKEIKKK